MSYLTSIVALIAVSASAAPAPSSAMASASASLDGKAQCVAFAWIPNETGSSRGTITVPAIVNGRTLRLQLDTGADVISLYGSVAREAGWAGTGDETFRAAGLEVAGSSLDRPIVHINADMEADTDAQGTLGLSALIGKVAVIDYPGRRFCLFAEADVPSPIAAAPGVRAMLRNSKFYIPVSVGTFASDAVVFDTGSSELALNVDLATWRAVTGRSTTRGAPQSYRGSAWGKPLILPGAPTASPVSIGKTMLGRVTVYTNPAQPAGFADWPVPTLGVLGNAPVWDRIVVMDMTARVRFAVIG